MQEDEAFKQNYLYQEIIEGGYNPESFQQFIIAENPSKGMNLQMWSMNQIKMLTKKFKDLAANQVGEDRGNSPDIKRETFQEEQSPKRYQNTVNIRTQGFYKIIDCKRPMVLGPIKQRSIAFIEIYQKRQGGLFEKSYIVFQVRVDTLKSCVMRRYSDFESLRDSLEISFPGTPIPPLPTKGKIKRKQQKHLQKRMYILEKFLNALLAIPEIRSSQLFQQFLTNKDPKNFYNEVTKLKKEKQIPIHKLQTISGKIQLKIDSQINEFLNKTKKYLIANQPDVKKIYKDFKGAATMFEGCGEYLNNINLACKSLSKNLNQYEKQCDLPQRKDNIFAMLSSMTSRYAQFLFEQAKIFRKQVYAAIKYESFMMLNYSQNLQRLSKMEQTFNDQKSVLLKKKQKLFEEGNMTRWGLTEKLTYKPGREQAYEIMLPKETKELMKQREKYGLYNYQTYKELQRYMISSGKILSRYFNEVFQKFSALNSATLIIWADLLTRITNLSEIAVKVVEES